ncbi:MAG: hypothetical protein EXR39_03420 [Betaproteobacteria bacterium]|nr:hypothetical protein [Betaproteobacteria bacterium]
MPSTANEVGKYQIGLRSYRNIGWALVVLGALCIVGAWSAQVYWATGVFGLLSGVGLYMALAAGGFDLDADGIRHRSTFGAWAIKWDEITHVEIGVTDGTFVLAGSTKRFILSPSGWWSGLDTGGALDFLVEQLKARNLPPQPSRTAAYKIMKNTRVERRAAL